jgi:hypothetical protein
MRSNPPFNPLDKVRLAESVAKALLAQAPIPLSSVPRFDGAGIYAIYYVGGFAPYQPISRMNSGGKFESPIYVGKAVPKGARKGVAELDSSSGPVLHGRLQEHMESISYASSSLRIDDFFCRYLVVDDIWIPLAESLLITRFSPVWNVVIDGFGIHDPGSGRYNQKRSAWDVIHPGRPWANRCAKSDKTQAQLLRILSEHFKRFSK